MTWSWTLAATAGGSFLGAFVYSALALMLWSRPGDAEARRASRAFGFYWGMTGAYQGLVGVQHALAAGGYDPFFFALGVRYVGLILASAGVGGLLAFFVYFKTGDGRWIPRISVLYAIVGALTMFHVWRSEPIAVARTPWSVDVAYANDFQGGLFLPLILALNLLPVVGALWYLTLVRKTSDRRQRYRIAAVGGGVALQLLSFTFARLTESPLSQLVSRTILAAAVALLVGSAYLSGTLPSPPARHAATSGNHS